MSSSLNESAWKPIDCAPKTTAEKVVYILIGDGICLPDVATWKPSRPAYTDKFGTRYCERPEGWFSVCGSRSRIKPTVWTHIPKY